MINREVFKGDLFIFREKQIENLALWSKDGDLKAKAGDRHLSFTEDYDGFFKRSFKNKNLLRFFEDNPNLTLIGLQDEQKRFVVTDCLYIDKDSCRFVNFDFYHHLLFEYGINYRMPVAKVYNGSIATIKRIIYDGTPGTWHLKNYGKSIIQTLNVNVRVPASGKDNTVH